MPRRYGGSPQPRQYGGYEREGSAAYQAEATPPGWFTGLSEAVGSFMDVRAQRKAEEQARTDKFDAMNQDIKGRMMLANADIESSFQKQEADQRESKLAAEKQTVIARLAERFTGGDLSAGAQLVSMGVPAATINALKPDEAKKADPADPEDVSYRRTKGALRANKEMGTGAFRPKAPEPPKPAMPLHEVRRRAQEGIRSMVDVVLDMNPNASRSAILNAVTNDPANADIAQNESFQRSLRADIDREMNDARRRRAPSGGAKQSTGARASALNKK